jgi:SAM-dependent methyltransferase
VQESWRFVDTTAAEREWFRDLDATLALARDPVGEPNRLRSVKRARIAGRDYFLKVFERTQPKNRLRNRCTAPRADLDAERELAVALALAERGVRTARPIAIGRRGPASFYLCAGLDGTSLRQLLAEGRCDDDLARRAARFAGSIGRLGVILPDLSADHLFVATGTDGAPEFAVIDLHNGRLARTPTRRDLVRALRHTARSVLGLTIARARAIAWAVRFVAAAGRRDAIRAVLRRLSPFDTHGRYDVPGRSRAYRQRDPARARREVELLLRVWPGRPRDNVLDVPCGVGRVSQALVAVGARCVGADRSRAMLAELRAADHQRMPLVQSDARHLPFADRSFDGVVVFRFLHHLTDETAQAVVAEAARVADRFVVVTFFHPVSLHGLRRRLAAAAKGRPPTRFAIRYGRLRTWLSDRGFEPVGHAAERPFAREFWVAAFERR